MSSFAKDLAVYAKSSFFSYTSLEKLTTLSRPRSWILKGPTSKRRKKKEKKQKKKKTRTEKKKKRKGEGKARETRRNPQLTFLAKLRVYSCPTLKTTLLR